MNEREINDFTEIDMRRLMGAVWQRIWIVLLTVLISLVTVLMGTALLIKPEYQSSAMFYVNNSSISVGDASLSISSGDITASKSLVNTYIVILNTRETLNDVIDYAGVDRTYAEVKKMIEAEAVEQTEIFRVVVTSHDPQEAEKLANSMAYILPKRISSIVEGTSAKIVESAVIPSAPSSPSYIKNMLMGFVLGVVLSVGFIVIREIFNITIRTEDDIKQVCHVPILASVPDMLTPGKGGGYSSYGSSQKQHPSTAKRSNKRPQIIGDNISFAASEAYKLLRTKLQFSFVDEESSGRVIGLSSAFSGEGKSLTAVNLAYSFAQLGKKVVLIDCDMRRPTIAEKLAIASKPGLSSLLTGQINLTDMIQKYGMEDESKILHVITAGEIPPNPVELLSSSRMRKLLDVLREHYEYIILDLPPVGEVTDAMAIAKETDGMLIVTRQNFCTRLALNDAIHQFEFIEAKLLGVVYNCTNESSGDGYSKKYYKKYYQSEAKANKKNGKFGK